jgi:hypothetical protein
MTETVIDDADSVSADADSVSADADSVSADADPVTDYAGKRLQGVIDHPRRQGTYGIREARKVLEKLATNS